MANWPQVSIDTKKERDMCFVCGPKNPVGLKVSFNWDGKVARAEFTPNRSHQGWSGVVHGGIISCLLDEAMSWAALFDGVNTRNRQDGNQVQTLASDKRTSHYYRLPDQKDQKAGRG